MNGQQNTILTIRKMVNLIGCCQENSESSSTEISQEPHDPVDTHKNFHKVPKIFKVSNNDQADYSYVESVLN